MDRFLDCLFENELWRLIISGEATEQELKETWNKIYSEYAEIMNDGSYNEIFDKVLEINYLGAKVFLADQAILFLTFNYDKKVNEILNEYGLQTQITEEDTIEKRAEKLIAVNGRVKRWVVDQSILQKELEEAQKINAANKGGKYYFEDCFDAISKYRKYSVRPETITVIQFCKALKQMEQEYNKQQLEMQK